ncbi:outer dynein arm-docking complex subunit 1-like [Scomber japonicus]|uniref:outer dynein arm-docking complex subunit 1-like n=1 Tax=Scomber japonicus TaxID=13676 RepID=UPI0023068A92|nr:outer dynein arm-docking complex subunit 1-like [Scomber japonicus]
MCFNAAETDLKRLQLQYRKAEEAKRAYCVKTQRLLYRDKREIQRLQDEQEELLCSLRVSQSCFNRQNDVSVVQDLTAMLASEDRIDEELEEEKLKIASLKDQILEWERKLAGHSEETVHRSYKSDKNRLRKTTYSMENKLDRGRKCFSQLMTRNGQLREDLKILQEEKKHFLRVKSKLEHELHTIRKDVCKLSTECTEAFSSSVKIQEKERMLRDQNGKEKAHYRKEKSKMEREIFHYSNCEAFLDIKAIARVSLDSDHRNEEQSKQLKCKEWGLEDFEDAIEKILRETGESDLDKLVRNFIQMEEQNYTVLKFVNYQHNEAQTIQRQISQLCKQMEIFVVENQQQLEQHQSLQSTVLIKQEAVNEQLEVYQQRVGFMEKLLDQLKKGVKSLLQISHDSSEICDKLSSSDGVQDENITEYLRMVEDRTNELLTLQSYLLFQENLSQWDTDSVIAEHLLGINPPVNLTTAATTPAPDNDPESVESVLLEMKEPMSRDDLLTLVSKRIQNEKTTD